MSKYYYQILGRVFPQILSLFVQSLFLEYIGIENIANFGIILFYYTVMYSVFSGGIDTIFLKLHDKQKLNYIIVHKVISHFIILLPSILLLHQFYKFDISTIILLTFGFLFQYIVESLLLAFRMLEKDIHTIYPKSIQLIIMVVFIILFEPSSLFVYSVFYLASWAIICILTYYIVISKIKFEYSYQVFISFFKSNWKQSNYLGITILITQILSNIDFILLEYFSNSITAGNYKLSLMLSQSFIPIIGATMAIYMSNLGKIDFSSYSINTSTLKNIIKKQNILIVIISLFFLLSSIFVFDLMYEYLFKEADRSFLHVSIILILSSILNSLSMVWSYLLVKLDMERIIFYSMITVVFTSLIMSTFLIYYYGVYGAISSNIISQLLILLLLKYKAKTILREFECVE